MTTKKTLKKAGITILKAEPVTEEMIEKMTKELKTLKEKIWEESKPAKDFPSDWLVIPVLDVNRKFAEAIQKLKIELSKHGEVNELGDVDSHMVYMGEVFEEIDKIFGEFE